MVTLPIKTCLYKDQEDKLNSFSGKHIFAQCDATSIVLYQTFPPDIAEYAVDHGFLGGPGFDVDRTTWLKPSFLWTMKYSDWATLAGRERVLAITLDKEFFAEILQIAVDTGTVMNTEHGAIHSETVTLQWEYDVDPNGECLSRYTLLVGLRGHLLQKLNTRYIEVISDITGFARDQHAQTQDVRYICVPTLEQVVPSKSVLNKLQFVDSLGDSEKRYDQPCQAKFPPNADVVLYYQGSFNPVHTQHVKAIQECKNWIEHITDSKVVAGVMGVKSDEFVAEKVENTENFDGLVIQAEHRVEMCKIAVAPYDWIHVYDVSGSKERDNLIDSIYQTFGTKVKVYHIYGADRGIEACNKRIEQSIIIGRKGWSKKLKKAHSNVAGSGTGTKCDIIVVPVEIEDVSSTAIRREIKAMSGLDSAKDKQAVLNRLAEKGWLDANVTEYLLRHEHSLYECAYNMTRKASYRSEVTHL